MNYNKIAFSFAKRGDDFNPDLVTQRIGLKPKEIQLKGEAIGKSGNAAQFSGWYFYSEISDNVFVSKLVEEVVKKLFDKIEIINELKTEFGLTSILEMVLWVDFNEEVPTPVIGHNLKTIEFLYKTKTETDVDIYKFDTR